MAKVKLKKKPQFFDERHFDFAGSEWILYLILGFFKDEMLCKDILLTVLMHNTEVDKYYEACLDLLDITEELSVFDTFEDLINRHKKKLFRFPGQASYDREELEETYREEVYSLSE